MKKSFGYELLLDLYGCKHSFVDDIDIVYRFLDQAVKTLGVSKQSPPFVFHSPEDYINPQGKIVDCRDKAGISAWVPLIESGIQCHTLLPKDFVSIDYYTCSTLDESMQNKLIELAKSYFQPTKIESKFVLRGESYYNE